MANGGAFPGFSPDFRAALERLSLAARRPARGLFAGDARSRSRGRALEFADHRPYVPGDDPRLVDWRAFARLDRLYVKQFEEERRRTLTLLVDASGSLDWGAESGEEAHKGVFARRLAAALAWVGLSRHDAVRAFLLRDGQAHRLPPATSRPAAGALLAGLGAAGEDGRTELAAAVRASRSGWGAGPVVLLSDLLDPTWAAALEPVAASGEGVVLQVLAPEEWSPSLGDEVELEDAETGERRETRLGPLELAAYRARLEAHLGAIGAECRRLDVRYAAIDTGRPLPEVVLRQLVKAGVLAG
ncbi:MAG TPA: DUF58 domain-containing protein [Chloroflexota bacterium]|nr:DUF58 domain-containing protein [Chloroflexota bacterium]